MLKRATVLLLVVLLGSYAAPVSAQNLTKEELAAQFAAELYNYASSHSEEEARAYAQYRLDQLTYSNLAPEPTQTNLLEAGISPEVLYGTGEYTSTIYLDLDTSLTWMASYANAHTESRSSVGVPITQRSSLRLQLHRESLQAAMRLLASPVSLYVWPPL